MHDGGDTTPDGEGFFFRLAIVRPSSLSLSLASSSSSELCRRKEEA